MALSLGVLASHSLPPSALDEIRDLCTEAFDEDFTGQFENLGPGMHVIGRSDGAIVAHAMWVARVLQPGARKMLRTAYVEAVATKPALQGRGFASQVLRRVATDIRDYDIGGLCTGHVGFYERFGWEFWRGPLFIRNSAQPEATPDEKVMILRLPRTPVDLDLDESLSAEWRRGELW